MSIPRTTRGTLLLSTTIVWTLWLVLMVTGERWHLFLENAEAGIPRWFMSITMAVGSFIAGATSEGGGAVAFPVMTLAFGIPPGTARDFSLLIQAVGMTSAAFTILCTRIQVERHAILWAGLGGAVGIILGLEQVAPRLPAAYAKMFFTATWLSFAFALFWINRYHDREVHTSIENCLPRHALLLVGTGIVGGVITSISGSGLDIATFSLLVLRLRVCERVATPTSVVLMGGNALVGALYRGGVQGALAPEAWSYWWVCVPIVVVGAPFGARFIRDRSRLFISAILYASIGTQTIAALCIIPLSPRIAGFSAAVFLAGILFFRSMANRGVRRLEWLASRRSSG